jgi:hypothetical protein
MFLLTTGLRGCVRIRTPEREISSPLPKGRIKEGFDFSLIPTVKEAV